MFVHRVFVAVFGQTVGGVMDTTDSTGPQSWKCTEWVTNGLMNWFFYGVAVWTALTGLSWSKLKGIP